MNGSNTAVWTFLGYTIAVFLLAVLSNRVAKNKEFVGEYFLGSRSFGVWAFALTFAATSASGGTFVGFPALIYSHGWTLALWISGYMVTPLIAMGLIGKRLNQVSRRCDALTIPEVMRRRFDSSSVNLVATAMLIFYMFFYLLAQFKAGGNILATLFGKEPLFQRAVAIVASGTQGIPWINRAEPEYLVCLSVFSLAVIGYVVYGGFRAVVWTDVMQGIVMFFGVAVMLGLALWQVGGLGNATRQMAKMTPPEHAKAMVSFPTATQHQRTIPKGTWIKQKGQVYRIAETATIPGGATSSEPVGVLQITTPFEVDRLLGKIDKTDWNITVTQRTPYARGANQVGVYVSNPGPSSRHAAGFLAISTAISFFIFFPFATTGQPSNMVRLLSFKDTRTLRISIVAVSLYFSFIYFSLVVIFCCARVLMPGMEIDPDRAMPDFAALLTSNTGMPWLAGLLVAAPFAAVMSSVDSFLLVVSSAVVRDIYQGHIHENAPEKKVIRLTHTVTVVVGILAVLCVLNPPTYLQDLIIFASGGMAGCFLIPIVLALYWRRMTSAATIAGMLGGTLAHLTLTGWGWLEYQEFKPYLLLGLDPFVWDILGSTMACVAVAMISRPPDPRLVSRFFDESESPL